MKWIVLDEKCGLLDESIRTYLNPVQIISIKYVPDQGVTICTTSNDLPYVLPCSTSIGLKLIADIIEFTTNKRNRKTVFNLSDHISQLTKEAEQVKKEINKQIHTDDRQMQLNL